MAGSPQVEQAEDPSAINLDEDFQNLKRVDTVHGDEALKVIAAAGGDDYWTEDEEKKLVRKIDWRLMPIMCVSCGVQFYDKAMLSQAVSCSNSSPRV